MAAVVFFMYLCEGTDIKDRKEMKRIIIALSVLLAFSAAAAAQSRTIGLRLGTTSLEGAYQHTMAKDQFIEGTAGFDFGYMSYNGLRLTGTYNFVWAHPAWTDKGSWAIYSGTGISIGSVTDKVVFNEARYLNYIYPDSGFMFSIAIQLGIEYSFETPLTLSLDMRPCFGLHFSDGVYTDPETGATLGFDGRTSGFYDRGMNGFIPSLTVRYKF